MTKTFAQVYSAHSFTPAVGNLMLGHDGTATGGHTYGALRDALWVERVAPDATGNSVTDTANLQAFMASLSAGDKAQFNPGEYLIADEIQYPPNVAYQGVQAGSGAGTRFKMANAANLDAIMVPTLWYSASGSPTSAARVRWEHCHFDGNKTNQSSGLGHGFVTMNQQSTFRYLTVANTLGDGILATNTTLAGNGITNSCNEMHFYRCEARTTTGVGIHIQDSTTAKLTDGWLSKCITQSTLKQGFYMESCAGWVVDGNHSYTAAFDAFRIDRPYRLRFTNNYAEFYGSSATTGTYCGLNCSTGFSIDGSILIANNTLNNTSGDVVGTTRIGIAVRPANSNHTYTTIIGNDLGGQTGTTGTVGILISGQSGTASHDATIIGNRFVGWDTPVVVGASGVYLVDARGNFGQTFTANTTFSATPAFRSAVAATQGGIVRMTLTANVTSSTMTDGVDGQEVTFMITENGTGGFTFAWPSNFVGAPSITTTANAVTSAKFAYVALTDIWYKL